MEKKNKQGNGGGNGNGNGGNGGNSDDDPMKKPRKLWDKDKWKLTKQGDTQERNGTTYYWCPECNEGKGMYAASHGTAHPSERHKSNFKAGLMAVTSDSASDGGDFSFGGGDFDLPLGMYGVVDDETYPKGHGRRTL